MSFVISLSKGTVCTKT